MKKLDVVKRSVLYLIFAIIAGVVIGYFIFVGKAI